MQIIYQRNAQPDHWPVERVYDRDDAVADALAADLADPEQTAIVLRFDTWLEHHNLIEQILSDRRNDSPRVGVVMATTIDPTMLDDRLHTLSLIKIIFDQFSDGRGFSLASILRSQLGLGCELRAVNVVRENLAMLEHCGYDSYELIDATNIDQAIMAFDELSANAA